MLYRSSVGVVTTSCERPLPYSAKHYTGRTGAALKAVVFALVLALFAAACGADDVASDVVSNASDTVADIVDSDDDVDGSEATAQEAEPESESAEPAGEQATDPAGEQATEPDGEMVDGEMAADSAESDDEAADDELADGDAEPDEMADDEMAAEIGDDAGRQELEEALRAEIDEWLTQSTAPGISLSVLLPGQDPLNIAGGIANIETGESVETDDYFRIASITKSMTAAVILTLVDEGLVELDAPVAEYLGDDWLGEHPSAASITVAQLMNHTNGLIEFAFDIGFYSQSVARSDQAYTPEEILAFLGEQPPLFAPGEQYQYETGGFVAAGLIIEAVTGKTAAEVMRERIFEPAGADAIYLTPQEFPPQQVVSAYSRELLFAAFSALAPELNEGLVVGDDDPVIDIYSGPQDVLQSAGWTGGGNEAQLESVAAIFAAMFDGTILTSDAIASMTDTVLDSGYGLGLSVDDIDGVTVYSHGGGVPGFRSQAGWLPDHNIAYAFSVNLIPLPEGADVGALTERMLPLLIEASS